MLLVQDQYVQNSRKNFDADFQLKQSTTKQVFPDTKEIWEIESGCEEEINTSGNDSEGDDILYADPSDIPEEVLDTRRQINSRKKNVRFGGPNFNCVMDTSETSSFDNEYPGLNCGYLEAGRRSLTQEPDTANHKTKDQFRTPHKTKWQTLDCVYEKTRPQSSPEKIAGFMEGMEKRQMSLGDYGPPRVRRKEHRCGRHHPGEYDFEEICRKPPVRPYKFESGDDVTARCCDHCLEKKTFMKLKPLPTQHKHLCHTVRESEPEVKNHRKMRFDSHYDSHAPTERYCPDEYYDHYSKTKKKTLEAVQEQQEQFSDSTYKIPCNKFSSQTIPGELLSCPRKKSLDKLTNSSVTDWLYYSSRGSAPVGPPKVHKTRSRRTRMNRVKNGWKKALVQTVRDGSRNERVGVLVMGSKGPEFYAKNSTKSGVVPFRKSKSFLDGPGKSSFEVMTVDCKNVFLSSSEPGPRTNQQFNDLLCPEEDVKVEEKIARYSKNVSEIVKNSEEKFYKALSSSEYPDTRHPTEGIFKGAGEGVQDEKKEEKVEEPQKPKLSPKNFPIFNVFSPRVSRSLRSPERKVNEESKAMACLLNEQGKQYLENQSKCKEDSYLEGLKELTEKFPPKEISKETAEANLSLWGMKLDQMSEETETKEEKENRKEEEEKEKLGKDETESEQTNKRTDEEVQPPRKSCSDTPKTSGNAKWDSQQDGDPISTVFRDLVESGMSREELENLQSVFGQSSYNQEVCSNEVLSSTSSEVPNTTRESKINVSPRSPKSPTSMEESKGCKKSEREKKETSYRREERKEGEKKEKAEGFLEESSSRKVLKIKNGLDERVLESKICKNLQGKLKEGKYKKKVVLDDRMKILRQALPSIAAENEAAHLKQLKRYIDRFIDRVEASTASEVSRRKDIRPRESPSTDSSEVRVDARKILDFVSNPFKKISSDVTINIAKKLTDALVQDKAGRCPKNAPPTKARKPSEHETDDDAFAPCNASSGSDRFEEPEPTYLKQLKKMRNEHLNNIVLEVKRLSELLRFLDRCNRLHS